jgi:hypothetical protein
MPNLECTESIPKCGYGKIHNCDRCFYATKSLLCMTNHTKRHQLPLKPFSCDTNDLEKYCCKECDFETDFMIIFNQHIREYHMKNIDFVQNQPKRDTVIKSYMCQKCSFETYSALLWIKHLDNSCFNTKKDFEKVRLVSCNDEKSYPCEYCIFETKSLTNLQRHQTTHHASGQGNGFVVCIASSKQKLKII